MMRSKTWARGCGVLMLALLLLPARLMAITITTADDLCMSTDDPCIVSTPFTVQDKSVIDVGIRELRLASGGVLDVGSGTMTLNVGTLTVQTGGFLRARGSTTATGGTIMVVAASVTVAPDASASPTSPVDASGAPGGTINISAANGIAVSGSISAKALDSEEVGGSVQLTAATATISAAMSALGGTDSAGGTVSVDTLGDLTINSTLDASGGGSDGGFVEVSTTTGNIVVGNSAVLRADAIAEAGSGGEVDLTASGDGVTTGLATISGLLSAKGINGTEDSGGGDGGAVCIETAGDIHMDVKSAVIIADAGAPDGSGGDIEIIVDGGVMTMQGTLSAAAPGTESSGGDVSTETATDTTIGGSILVTAGDGGGGTVELCSDEGSVSLSASGVVNASGSAVADGDGGSICLESGSDLSAPQAVLVAGDLIADGGPGGGAGGIIDLEGSDSVRIASTGSVHASGGNGGGGGGTLTANADPGITSIEGPMTAAGGSPSGSGGVLTVSAGGLVSITAPLDGSGFGGHCSVTIGTACMAASDCPSGESCAGAMVGISTTTGPVQVFDDITVASSAGPGGTIEIMGAGDAIVAGTLTSTGGVTPGGSIQILSCNVTLCGLDAQSCPAGSTGVLTSLGPSGVNRITDRNSTGIFGTMSANKNSGSNDLVYDGNAAHKPVVIGGAKVTPAASLVVDATLMPCPICGDHIIEPPETCDDGNTNDGDGCSSTCQKEASLPGDANGDHVVTIDDLGVPPDSGLIQEIFDGDGDSVSMVSGGAFPGSPGADANGDTFITAADITATIKILFPAP